MLKLLKNKQTNKQTKNNNKTTTIKQTKNSRSTQTPPEKTRQELREISKAFMGFMK